MLTLVENKINILIEETKNSLLNIKRVSIDQAWKILQLAIASVVQVLEVVGTDLAGKDKKELALKYLNKFYDSVFIVVDIPFVPPLVEPLLHKYIKLILMTMASASIDATVTIFRQTGVFKTKENTQ